MDTGMRYKKKRGAAFAMSLGLTRRTKNNPFGLPRLRRKWGSVKQRAHAAKLGATARAAWAAARNAGEKRPTRTMWRAAAEASGLRRRST
jgi:hypothetical protein